MHKMISTTTAALKAALTMLTVGLGGRGPLIPTRSTIPVLSCCLLSVSETGVPFITGTDLDIQAVHDLPGAGTPGFAMVVDARALKAAVSNMKAATIELADLGGALAVRPAEGPGATVKLPAPFPAADFPRIVEPARDAWAAVFDVPASQLLADLARMQPFVSTEETRYYLNGVFWHLVDDRDGKRWRMAATDGHRLGRIDRPVPADAEHLPDVIIPAKAAAFMMRALKGHGEIHPVIGVTPSKIELRTDGWKVLCKLIDGTFPDYSRVIPTMNDKRLAIQPKALASDIEAVTAHVGDRCRGVTLSAGEGWATVYARCATNGPAGAVIDSVVACDLGTDKGVPNAETWFGCNAAYLVDILSLFSTAETMLAIADDRAPLRFDAEGVPEFLAVLMPMRTGSGSMLPAAIASLNQTPVDAFEQALPALVAFIAKGGDTKQARRELGRLAHEAIEHLARPGERRRARLTVLRMIAQERNVVEHYTAELDHKPRTTFALWSAYHAREAATYEAARMARLAATAPAVGESNDHSELAMLRAKVAALETRNRRLAAVAAGRKRQLSVVGEALAISRERCAKLTRRATIAGSSTLALAAAETAKLDAA